MRAGERAGRTSGLGVCFSDDMDNYTVVGRMVRQHCYGITRGYGYEVALC